MKPSSVNEHWLIFDCETNGLYDQVSTVHCIVIYDINKQQTFTYGPDRIDDAIAHLATADVLIGHNVIFYDVPVLQKLYPSFQPTARIIDTLICSRLIWPKELLYDLDTEQYTQVPSHLRGSPGLKAWGWRLANHKINFKDFTEYSQEMLDYCVQDVVVTKDLWEIISVQNYPGSTLKLEHDFALAINRQIRAGFPFDMDACLDLVDDLRAKQTELENKLKEIFPPIKHETTFIPKVNNKNRGYVKGEPFIKVNYETFNPGSLSQRTDGGPTQPATYIPGLPQGEGQATYDQQVAAPMMGAVKMEDIEGANVTTDLSAPTEFPNEPIHHGASWGDSPTINPNSLGSISGSNPTNIVYRMMSYDTSGKLEALYNRLNMS